MCKACSSQLVLNLIGCYPQAKHKYLLTWGTLMWVIVWEGLDCLNQPPPLVVLQIDSAAISSEAEETSLHPWAVCIKNLYAGKDQLRDSASSQHSVYPFVSFWKPPNLELCVYRLGVLVPKGQGIDNQRPKGKTAAPWFIKWNTGIKTCRTVFGRDVNTQDKTHKHFRYNPVISLFCLIIVCLPYKCHS